MTLATKYLAAFEYVRGFEGEILEIVPIDLESLYPVAELSVEQAAIAMAGKQHLNVAYKPKFVQVIAGRPTSTFTDRDLLLIPRP